MPGKADDHDGLLRVIRRKVFRMEQKPGIAYGFRDMKPAVFRQRPHVEQDGSLTGPLEAVP
jgi:hypothetical protein